MGSEITDTSLNCSCPPPATADVRRVDTPSRRSIFQAIRGRAQYLFGHPGFRQSPIRTLSRLIQWRLHCALGIPATVQLPMWDARMYLPPRWGGAGTTMIYTFRWRYEAELTHLSHFILPGMVVVDGGASCGIYTIAAAKLVGPKGLVLSFEPGANAYRVLTRNVCLNGLKNVRTYAAALSDKDGKAPLFHHQNEPHSFSLGSRGTQESRFEQVATRTLSRVTQEEDVRRIGFIKLDVEGAEELVLRDASQLIAHSCPTIILEINGAAARRMGLDPNGSWKLLKTLGYLFFSLTGSGALSPLRDPPAENEVVNVIAIHRRNANESLDHRPCV